MAKLTRRMTIRRTVAMMRCLNPENLHYIYKLVLFLLRSQGKDGATK